MILLRRLLGDVLRRQRQRQGRTLREVSSSARVSLGYLSEVERGQKEASSELLSAICDALDVPMSEVMREVSDDLSLAELSQSAAGRDRCRTDAAPAGRGHIRHVRQFRAVEPGRTDHYQGAQEVRGSRGRGRRLSPAARFRRAVRPVRESSRTGRLRFRGGMLLSWTVSVEAGRRLRPPPRLCHVWGAGAG